MTRARGQTRRFFLWGVPIRNSLRSKNTYGGMNSTYGQSRGVQVLLIYKEKQHVESSVLWKSPTSTPHCAQPLLVQDYYREMFATSYAEPVCAVCTAPTSSSSSIYFFFSYTTANSILQENRAQRKREERSSEILPLASKTAGRKGEERGPRTSEILPMVSFG